MADQEKGKVFAIELPSRGVMYVTDEGAKQLPGGKLSLRPMSTVEESILYSPTGDGLSKVRTIINNCIATEGMDPYDLLLVDRLYVLLSLRIKSLGPEMEVPVRCAGCGQQFKHLVNIIDSDRRPAVKDKRLLDGIRQLTYIARPRKRPK